MSVLKSSEGTNLTNQLCNQAGAPLWVRSGEGEARVG